MIRFEETFVGDEPLPRVWRITQGQDASREQMVDWLREHKGALNAARDTHGAVLVRGFQALDSAPAFADVLGAIANDLMEYVGGTAPRKVVHGRVTTASGLPGTHSLALHQEMAYQASRPDALALFCEVPPDEMGETPLADARKVTERLDPGVRARFDAQGVGVRRALRSPSTGEENSIPRPWNQVFLTTDRDEVERIAREKEWKVEWRPDESMLLWQQVLPAFKAHPRTGERVWANQVHYHMPECMVRWALRDGRSADVADLRRQMAETPELMDHCFHRDGTRVSAEDAEHVWDVLEQSEVPWRWERGDVLLLDNVLAMHGRRQYRGQRRILVGMIKD
ncbi:hypothetical protein MFUL124B02_21340 [Myxococcus fulvus 124B02]|nr:hypothetical protein MFUL124B02_21340 [Myxococcus fulvus 124B02]